MFCAQIWFLNFLLRVITFPSQIQGAEFTQVFDENDLEGRPYLYPLESEYDRFTVGLSLCKNVGGMGVYAGVRGMLTDGCCAALYYHAGFFSERWKRRQLRQPEDQRQPIFRYVETGGYQGLSAHVVATSLQNTIGISSALIYSHDLFDEYIPDKEVSIIENSGFWENYMDGAESRLQKFYSNVQRNNFEKIIIPISGPSTRTLKIHPSNSVQMVFIDGDHTYQGALFDLYEGWRILEPGGIMLVHDCLPTSTEPRDPNSKLEVLEVREAVRDFSESHNISWHLMIGTMYIAVLGKPLS